MKKSSVELGVGIFVLLGIICVGYLAVQLGKMELLGDDHYFLNARFHSVSGLKTGSQVEIAGVKVGQVDSITLDREAAHLKDEVMPRYALAPRRHKNEKSF